MHRGRWYRSRGTCAPLRLVTTGSNVAGFENAVAGEVQMNNTVAVSSGTAALHAAVYAIGIKPGDEVIIPCMTFAATANTVVFQGGSTSFCRRGCRNIVNKSSRSWVKDHNKNQCNNSSRLCWPAVRLWHTTRISQEAQFNSYCRCLSFLGRKIQRVASGELCGRRGFLASILL